MQKFTSLVSAEGTTELPWSYVFVKDCHSDISPVKHSDSNSEVIQLDTTAALTEWRH